MRHASSGRSTGSRRRWRAAPRTWRRLPEGRTRPPGRLQSMRACGSRRDLGPPSSRARRAPPRRRPAGRDRASFRSRRHCRPRRGRRRPRLPRPRRVSGRAAVPQSRRAWRAGRDRGRGGGSLGERAVRHRTDPGTLERRIRVPGGIRLGLHAGTVLPGQIGDWVDDRARRTRSCHHDHARSLARTDEDVVCSGRAVDEVPRPQTLLLAVDQHQAFSGDDQKVLLDALAVIQPVRLAGPEDMDVHPVLRKLRLAFQICRGAEILAVPPGRISGIEHVPALSPGDDAVFGLLEPCLLDHQTSRLGRSSLCSLAGAIASAYPASAWRITPVPGSVVSTRSSRSSASAEPSATTTMPAWIELPIPTPPPWWTLTQVAPAATLSRALRIGQSAIASEPSAIASVSRYGDATEPASR